MGAELPHIKVKLVIPILYSDTSRLNRIISILEKRFGEIDYQTEPFLFTFTHYYDDEMEADTYRTFLSFKKLIAPEKLVDIKRITNKIELKFAVDGKRKVNLDPGYLSEGKFILATTKDQQHRIYIGKNIYKEVTLYFRSKEWHAWPWTYPDYASEKYRKILLEIRNIYKKQVITLK